MKFCVVAFVKSKKEVEIVPVSWTYSENGGFYTFWPRYRDMESIKTAAKSEDPPNRTRWSKYAIRILHKFDTYEEAEAQISHFFENSDYGNSVLTPQAPSDASRSSSGSPESMASKFSLSIPKFPSSRPGQHFETPRARPAVERRSLDEVNMNSILNKLRAIEESFTQSLVEIKEGQRDIRATLEDIKVKLLEGPRPCAANTTNWKSLGLPFGDLTELTVFDSKLEPNSELRESLVTWLSRSGGSSLEKVVNAILGKILMDSLAVQLTYYGTATKPASAHLNLKEIVYESVVLILPAIDEKQFKLKVQSFLDHAGDRMKAKQKAEQKKLSKSRE